MGFPATLALVRVQESGYRSESASSVGQGAYSVVTTRDIETEKDLDTISKLPGVGGVATLNRLLLPQSLSSDLDLREAAAKLQTEAILLYTIATEFSDNEVFAPLTTLTLGLAPNKRYKINSTASAILMDTKTGYIYGALEESQTRSGLTIAWGGVAEPRRDQPPFVEGQGVGGFDAEIPLQAFVEVVARARAGAEQPHPGRGIGLRRSLSGRNGLLEVWHGLTLGLHHRRAVENPLEIGKLQRRAVLSFDGFSMLVSHAQCVIGVPWIHVLLKQHPTGGGNNS